MNDLKIEYLYFLINLQLYYVEFMVKYICGIKINYFIIFTQNYEV